MPDKCASCGGAVPSDCVEFNDELFCDACFCCHKCKKDFPDGEFCDEKIGGKTKFFHEACLPPAGGGGAAASSAPLESCDGCKKQFAVKEEFIVLKGKGDSTTTLRYHDKCFVCQECLKPIGNAPYGVSHGKPIHSEGPCAHGAIVSKTQGSSEFEEDLNCEACGERIRGKKKQFELNGKMMTYHLTCLKCQGGCGLGITQDVFLIDGKPVCHRCKK